MPKALILGANYDGASIYEWEDKAECGCGKIGAYANKMFFSKWLVTCPECAMKDGWDDVWEVELIKTWR